MMRLPSASKLARFAFASLWLTAFLGLAAVAAEPSAKLKALQDSAAQLGRAGANREALAKSQEAFPLVGKEFGPDSEEAAIQSYEIAFFAEALGDLTLAERQYREFLVRIREIVYGPESAGVSVPLENLGTVLLKAGRPAEAEPVFEHVLKIRKDLIGDHAFSAGAYAGLGETHLARGDAAGALPYYRKAVTLLTTQNTAQAVVKSIVETDIKRHRDVFIGLARAASGLRREPGADAAALADETYGAGQLAWATSAASALAKMTARLRAGDTELGRSIRGLEALSNRVVALNEEDMKALAAWSEVQKSDPGYSKLLGAFRAASIERGRASAPAVKRQKQLVEGLQALLARCPPAEAKPGCEDSPARREAITKELGALSAETSKGAADITTLGRQMQAAEEVLPGYADFKVRRTARIADSQRLEQQLAADRAAIVAKFPDYLSLAEPHPLSIADTQGLLSGMRRSSPS